MQPSTALGAGAYTMAGSCALGTRAVVNCVILPAMGILALWPINVGSIASDANIFTHKKLSTTKLVAT
jgi:hypothetical protein